MLVKMFFPLSNARIVTVSIIYCIIKVIKS